MVKKVDISTSEKGLSVRIANYKPCPSDFKREGKVILKLSNGLFYKIMTRPDSFRDKQGVLHFELVENKKKTSFKVVNFVVCLAHYPKTFRALMESTLRSPASGQNTVPTSTTCTALLTESMTEKESFLVMKSIVILAKQPSFCLPIRTFLERLDSKAPCLKDYNLTLPLLQNLDLFCLFGDSNGEMNVSLQLNSITYIKQLLTLSHNVSVFHGKHQIQAPEQKNLTAWVSSNSIILFNLQGFCFQQGKIYLLVVSFDDDLLSVSFDGTEEMAPYLAEDILVTVCIKVVAFGQHQVHAFPLSLEAEIGTGQNVKIYTEKGKKVKFNNEDAIQVFPEQQKELRKDLTDQWNIEDSVWKSEVNNDDENYIHRLKGTDLYEE
jgi:hypothetical protein